MPILPLNAHRKPPHFNILDSIKIDISLTFIDSLTIIIMRLGRVAKRLIERPKWPYTHSLFSFKGEFANFLIAQLMIYRYLNRFRINLNNKKL